MRSPNNSAPGSSAAADTAPHTAANPAAVTVEGLHTGYGNVVALEDVSFTVRAGALVGLVGPNGSGKSTLIKALLGLLPVWSGRVEILGRPPVAARAVVGYTPQAEDVDWTFPVTVRDVVAMGLYRPRWGRFRLRRRAPAASAAGSGAARVDQALRDLDLAGLASRQVGELSGGQQRRVLVARALVKDPAVLLLDEPTAGLDAPAEEALLDIFSNLAAAGRTLLVATHDIPCVFRRYDFALLLDRRVIAYGPPAEIMDPATLTRTFGRHVVQFGVGDQEFVAQPHTQHQTPG